MWGSGLSRYVSSCSGCVCCCCSILITHCIHTAVNARVSQVSDWIDEVVCALSENPPADFCRPEKWRWPAAASTRPILLGAVALMAALVVVLRLRKRASALESKRLPPSEQTSLCDSLSSSDSDYEAVEIT